MPKEDCVRGRLVFWTVALRMDSPACVVLAIQ